MIELLANAAMVAAGIIAFVAGYYTIKESFSTKRTPNRYE